MYELEALMDNLYLVDKNNWETTRTLAYIIAQGRSTKKLSPEKIMKFPWDEEENQRERISEDDKKHYDEMWKKEEERIKKFMKK